MKVALVLLAALLGISSLARAEINIQWQEVMTTGTPAGNGYLSIHYDPVSQCIAHYGAAAGTTTIYSTDLYFYCSDTHTFTHHSGNGFGQGGSYDNDASCLTTDSSSFPKDGHQGRLMAVDTTRNVLWFGQRLCQGDISGAMYKLTLNADSTTDAFTKLTPAATPVNDSFLQAMAYDSEDDILFQWGYDGGAGTHNHWCYNVGAANATQQTIGCSGSDTWTEITVSDTQPETTGFSFPWMAYSRAIHKVLVIGTTGVGAVEIWTYSLLTKMWDEVCQSCSIPDNDASPQNIAAALDESKNVVFLQHMNGTGAPKTFAYNILADTLTELSVTGTGPVSLSTGSYTMAYDAAHRKLIAWSMSASDVHLWEGSVEYAPATQITGNGQFSGTVSIQ